MYRLFPPHKRDTRCALTALKTGMYDTSVADRVTRPRTPAPVITPAPLTTVPPTATPSAPTANSAAAPCRRRRATSRNSESQQSQPRTSSRQHRRRRSRRTQRRGRRVLSADESDGFSIDSDLSLPRRRVIRNARSRSRASGKQQDSDEDGKHADSLEEDDDSDYESGSGNDGSSTAGSDSDSGSGSGSGSGDSGTDADSGARRRQAQRCGDVQVQAPVGDVSFQWVRRSRRRRSQRFNDRYWESKDAEDEEDSDGTGATTGTAAKGRRDEVMRLSTVDFAVPVPPGLDPATLAALPPADLNVSFVKKRAPSARIVLPFDSTVTGVARQRLLRARERRNRQKSSRV